MKNKSGRTHGVGQNKFVICCAAMAFLGAISLAPAQTLYNGNGITPPNSNAGTGALGGSVLAITAVSNATTTTLNFTWTLSSAMATSTASYSGFQLYFDTVSGGASSTSVINPGTGSNILALASSTNKNSGVKNDVSFASGFLADYVVAIRATNTSLGVGGGLQSYQMISTFPVGVNGAPTMLADGNSFTFSLTTAQLGLAPLITAPTDIKFVASYFDPTTGTRYGEAMGPFSSLITSSTNLPGTASFSGYDTFTIVPEPSSMALLSMVLVMSLVWRRKWMAT